ncbi:MAG: helix-turn-helix transcriptional regulator [Bacteroidota bacterium]
MSQQQLSETSGLTVAQISDFENGKVNITFDSLRKLCNGLSVKPVVLFDWP